MPMLFWLPTIFFGAFLEMAKIAYENIDGSETLSGGVAGVNVTPAAPRRAYPSIADTVDSSRDAARLNAQVESLKQVVALLRDQLADLRKEKDKWQSRAERISLTASY
jgi:hypothetical protein